MAARRRGRGRAIEVCEAQGIEYVLDVQRPREDWTYRRLVLTSPSGYRVALEGPQEETA